MANKQKTYIHVNQHKIRSNLKNNETEPCITVKKGKSNTYCHEVHIDGPSKVLYGGNDKPILSCGARVVIETESEITAIIKEKWCKYQLEEYTWNANSKMLKIAVDNPKKK
tara:strand:+ start:102 stop:434 length:333 start_codon:yes stop_codon:yes gene_type:complete